MLRSAALAVTPEPSIDEPPRHPGAFTFQAPCSASLTMLYPIDSETREVRELDGIWDFCLDPLDRGIDEHWEFQLWPERMSMPVPASFNDIGTEQRVRDHVGPVWYRREFFCPESWRGRSVRLRIGAAAHDATVWINGSHVVRHRGGFLPFEAEIDPVARFGSEGSNIVVVRVSNVLDWTTLPPGQVSELPWGGKRQDYFHDFYNYAGICRPVRLIAQPVAGIDDVRVEVTRTGQDARVRVHVATRATRCEVALRDAGTIVATAEGQEVQMTVVNPRWWSPDSPTLYDLTIRVFDEAAGLRDVYHLPVGLRTVRVDGDRFLLNEQPFYFRGFGRHEDSDVRGKGSDHAINVRDVALLKWIGANSVRSSHYPYAEEFLRLADREGIAVIGECPAVGLYLFNEQEDPKTPIFTPDKAGADLRRHHRETVREMIARDRNHACILMWSLGNETATHEAAGLEHFADVIHLARQMDPTRPITVVECNYPRHDRIGELVDVIAINRYYGWYLDSGDLGSVGTKFRAELAEWRQRWKKPILLSEYGADTIAGLHKLPSTLFTEEFQVEFLSAFHEVLDLCPFIVGEHVWAFADFATKQGISRVDGNRKGVFTRQRQPKAAAFSLRARWLAVARPRAAAPIS